MSTTLPDTENVMRPLSEIAAGLSKMGLQTHLLPGGDTAPDQLLLGLGQDYRQRDRILTMLYHNDIWRRQGIDAPDSPCVYALVMQLPFQAPADRSLDVAEFLDSLNRLLGAGQVLLLPDGQLHLRYHWMLEAFDWTLLPLVDWLDMTAFYLNHATEPLEQICLGSLSGAQAVTALERKLGDLLREA